MLIYQRVIRLIWRTWGLIKRQTGIYVSFFKEIDGALAYKDAVVISWASWAMPNSKLLGFVDARNPQWQQPWGQIIQVSRDADVWSWWLFRGFFSGFLAMWTTFQLPVMLLPLLRNWVMFYDFLSFKSWGCPQGYKKDPYLQEQFWWSSPILIKPQHPLMTWLVNQLARGIAYLQHTSILIYI